MQSPAVADPLLVTIILGTLAVGLPILMVLAIRFLWDRNVKLGRSKDLEKLVWQLHRIASALEHQMNLSFPAVQPGTEDPHDLAFLQQIAAEPKATAQSAVISSAAAPAPSTVQPEASQSQPAQEPPKAAPPLLTPMPKEVPVETAQRGGVNSMFGL